MFLILNLGPEITKFTNLFKNTVMYTENLGISRLRKACYTVTY